MGYTLFINGEEVNKEGLSPSLLQLLFMILAKYD